MPQNKIQHAAIQRDDALFARTCKDIASLTAVAIAAKGLVSHTTVTKYLRREPVTQSREDALIESIRLLRQEREAMFSKKREAADAILSA